MGIRLFLIAASSLALASAAPPSAWPPGYVPPAPPTTTGQKYAACVVARERKGSDRLVRAEPGTDEENTAFASLAAAFRACDRNLPGGEAEPARAMLRGLMAERLWLTSTFLLSRWASFSFDPNKIDFDKGFDATTSLRDAYRLAFCVAYINPEEIDALIRTVPSSEAEQTAFEALKQPISRCFAHGRSLALERPFLRAMLAEQLYRHFPPIGFEPSFRRRPPTHPGMIGIPGQTNGMPRERPSSH